MPVFDRPLSRAPPVQATRFGRSDPVVATHAPAAKKKRIDRAADLPRFSYHIDGKLEELVRDEARFRSFAVQVWRDDESVLRDYDIGDKATRRQLLSVLAELDFLDGRYQAADQRAIEIRALEEKPADKLISGMLLRSMVAAYFEIDKGASPTQSRAPRASSSSRRRATPTRTQVSSRTSQRASCCPTFSPSAPSTRRATRHRSPATVRP